jgi:uncharacterized membrane protein required for colicin V production
MGLDLALGVIVLLAAIRGWLKGFILQALRLAGLVGCVYAADPLRDLAKPYVLPHLPSMRPELVDRLLWWSAVAIAYVVLVGLATLLFKLSRRQAFGLAEPRRNDQYAGFALGAAKGLVVVMLLVAALEKYAVERVKGIVWADEQVQGSKVLKWNAQYQPGMRIWESPPVRHFVDHVQQMGLKSPERTGGEPDSKPLQATSTRPPRLLLPSVPGQALEPAELDTELTGAVESIKKMLSQIPIPLPAPAAK